MIFFIYGRYRKVIQRFYRREDRDLVVDTQDNTQVTFEERILQFCEIPRSKKEIAGYMGYKDAKNFGIRYIGPMVESGKLNMTVPEKPSSRNQKYKTTEKYLH